MLEEHGAIGTPVHCTGLLGLEAFDEFDLPRDLILGQAGTARFWGAAGQSVTIRSERIQAAVIDRAALDRASGERARPTRASRSGAACRAEAVDVGPAAVRVTASGLEHGRDRARVCAGLRRQLSFSSAARSGPAGRLPSERAARNDVSRRPSEIEVRFGSEVAPSGFAWLVPFRRDGAPHARIGLMSETRGGALRGVSPSLVRARRRAAGMRCRRRA